MLRQAAESSGVEGFRWLPSGMKITAGDTVCAYRFPLGFHSASLCPFKIDTYRRYFIMSEGLSLSVRLIAAVQKP
jgi:hypothetical protein